MAEEYILKWNNHNCILLEGCHDFLERGELADVTLSAGGLCIQAHRLILSVFSPYFQRLFQATPSNHPVIVLKDVRFADLKALLHFMYEGEVTVSHQNINSLMETAILLEVKGLALNTPKVDIEPGQQIDSSVNGKNENEPPITTSTFDIAEESFTKAVEDVAIPSADKVTASPNTTESTKDNISDNIIITQKTVLSDFSSAEPEPKKIKTSSPSEVGEESVDVNVASTSKSETPKQNLQSKPRSGVTDSPIRILDIPSKEKGGSETTCQAVKCPKCNRIFANRYNLKVHIRDQHVGSPVDLRCTECNKVMRNLSCLRMHQYNHKKQQLAADAEKKKSTELTVKREFKP